MINKKSLDIIKVVICGFAFGSVNYYYNAAPSTVANNPQAKDAKKNAESSKSTKIEELEPQTIYHAICVQLASSKNIEACIITLLNQYGGALMNGQLLDALLEYAIDQNRNSKDKTNTVTYPCAALINTCIQGLVMKIISKIMAEGNTDETAMTKKFMSDESAQKLNDFATDFLTRNLISSIIKYGFRDQGPIKFKGFYSHGHMGSGDIDCIEADKAPEIKNPTKFKADITPLDAIAGLMVVYLTLQACIEEGLISTGDINTTVADICSARNMMNAQYNKQASTSQE